MYTKQIPYPIENQIDSHSHRPAILSPKRKLIESQLPNVIKNTPSQSSNDEAACESEDLESENLEYKLSEPPSPTPTPQ